MKALFGCAAAALFVAHANAASAQAVIIEREAPTVITRERIELTPAQRTTIYRTVTRQRLRPAPSAVDVRLGAHLPRTIELREIPSAVIAEVPTIRSYRYTVTDDEVVLVDPATSEIVEIIRQ
jgi:Protein of unknown function (DUF1236)